MRSTLPGRHEEEAGRSPRAGPGVGGGRSRPAQSWETPGASGHVSARSPLSKLQLAPGPARGTDRPARERRPRWARSAPASAPSARPRPPPPRPRASCAGAGVRASEPGPVEPTPGFSPRPPDPKPQPRGPRLRGPALPGSDLGPLLSQSEPHARRAQAPASPAGGPHLGLLVSTLPLTSGTSPALRAPRGGWNPGDLAVVAEAVEACLRSPWKPPQARSRGGLRGASPPRGRPGPQLPPAERPRRSRKPS